MISWQEIETEYITTDISLYALGNKYGICDGTIRRRAAKGGWNEKKDVYRNKTTARILDAVSKKEADRTERFMDVADKLLQKVETMVDQEEPVTAVDIRNLSDALKNIKTAQMLRTPEDIAEHRARIEKLRAEVNTQEVVQPVRVLLDTGAGEYSR